MTTKTTPWTALLIATLLIGGCGGDGSAQATGAEAPEETAAQAPEEMSPTELGQAIGALYVDAIEAVAKETAERPEPATLRPKLEEMKGAYVADLVELGRAREALAAADRATVDGAIRMSMGDVSSATFTAYAEGQGHYLDTDRELADLIASFNVITQYANFDLLKKQAPAEAERLGIE